MERRSASAGSSWYLTYLGLDGCNTCEAAEEALRQQIPGLEIVHEREAVESDEDEEGELSD